MDWQTLIVQPEGERLEKKRDASSSDFLKKVMRTLCAFANNINASGEDAFLLVGVRDDGTMAGFRDALSKVEAQIANSINDAIIPKMHCEIKSHQTPDGDLIVIRIPPLPYCYEYIKKVYYRLGSTTREADQAAIGKIIRQKRGGDMDAQPCIRAKIHDIEPTMFAGYQQACVDEALLAANHRDYDEQLAQQGFYDFENLHPTLAGILMCGANPQQFYRESYVSYIRFSGEDINREEITNRVDFSGNLIKQWHAIESFMPSMNETWYESSGEQFSSMREIEVSSYSNIAIRELLLNALCHRDYLLPSPIHVRQYINRLVITSPGGLVMPAQPNNFPTKAAYRNPLIMAAFRRLKWVEKGGTGVLNVMRVLKKNGYLEATFDWSDPNFVSVTLWAKSRVKP